MSRWIKVVGGGLAVAVAFATAGLAGEGSRRGHDGPGRGHGGGAMMGLRLLDLSESQKDAVKQLSEQHHDAVRPLFEQQQALQTQLDTALGASQPDAARVGQLVIQRHALGEQMKAERGKLEAAVVALLTPEQKQMWDRLKAVREQERGERGWRGNHQGHGPRGDAK
jgi:protein CpxP